VKQYYRLLQDDEMNFQRVIQTSAPMTFNFYPRGTLKLTEEIQRYWHALNDNDLQAWSGGELGGYPDAAFCNGAHKVRLNRDYITRQRLDQELPVRERVMCGRNVVYGEETISNGVYGIPFGTPVLRLETMYPDELQNVTYATRPHLIHVGTIITTKPAPNGLRQVNAFPHRGGREGKPVFYPLISDEPVYYPLSMLEKLPNSSGVPSVYNPPNESTKKIRITVRINE